MIGSGPYLGGARVDTCPRASKYFGKINFKNYVPNEKKKIYFYYIIIC
jgi:hypothetical protein